MFFLAMFVVLGLLYFANVVCVSLWKVAPWKSNEERLSFWMDSWLDKFVLGVVSILFALITPFMFYFMLVHDYIPNGEYRIKVDVSGYELPCDLVVGTNESEYVERNGDVRTSYSKSFYLYMAYWPNGGQLKIDEYIDPDGEELEIYDNENVYTIRTQEITQEFLGIDSFNLAKKRLFSGDGIALMALELASLYMSVQFVCTVPKLQVGRKENEQ